MPAHRGTAGHPRVSEGDPSTAGALLQASARTRRRATRSFLSESPTTTTAFSPFRFMTRTQMRPGSSTARALPKSSRQSRTQAMAQPKKHQTSSSDQAAEYFRVLDQPSIDNQPNFAGLGLWFVLAQSTTRKTNPIRIYCYSHQVDVVSEKIDTYVAQDVDFELSSIPCNNGQVTEYVFPCSQED